MGELANTLVSKEEEEKLFNQINSNVFGLIMDLKREVCNVHKLEMKFHDSMSKLYAGKQELSLEEGYNRFIGELECRPN